VPSAVTEPDPLQHLDRAPPCLFGSHPAQQQRQLDVLGRGEHRDQVEGLEDEPHGGGPVGRALGVGHREQVLAGDQHPAAVDVVQAGQAVQQGGLARSGWPHDRHHLALVDGEVQVDQGLHLDLPGAVHLADLLGDEQRGTSVVGRARRGRLAVSLPLEHVIVTFHHTGRAASAVILS
jgi:hypothetical protein